MLLEQHPSMTLNDNLQTKSKGVYHMNKTHTTPAITEEQINRCHRIEGPDGVFYQVESERDPLTEYVVKALKRNGKTYYTCTCPAGQEGRHCKHINWARAHSEWYRAQQNAIHIVEEFRLPRSTTVIYTVAQGPERHDVVRYGNGSLTCNCKEYETAIERQAPMCCKHTLEVTQHLQQYLEEMAQYLHEVATSR
jgi:hypothetical protein